VFKATVALLLLDAALEVKDSFTEAVQVLGRVRAALVLGLKHAVDFGAVHQVIFQRERGLGMVLLLAILVLILNVFAGDVFVSQVSLGWKF